MSATKPISIRVNINDGLIDLMEALRQRLPNPPSVVTAWRWRTRGVNGVKLPAVRCGRDVMTTLPAIDEFIRRQSEVK